MNHVLYIYVTFTKAYSLIHFTQALPNGDWAGLAGLIYADIFNLDFLSPISESETIFRLEPHSQLNLTRYLEMVKNATTGIDLLDNLYAPRGNIQIKSPYLEVSAFNPRSKAIAIFKKNGKES